MGSLWFRRILQGDEFRQQIERALVDEWGIDGRFEVFRWSGTSVACEGFEGKGHPGSPVARLRASDIRLTFDLPGILRQTWDLREGSVGSLDLVWDPGGANQGTLRGMGLTFSSGAAGWRLSGRDGRLAQIPLPPITVTEIHLTATHEDVVIKEALFRGPAEAWAKARGVIRTLDDRPQLDLAASFGHIPLSPFLSTEWQDRFTGSAAGNLVAEGPLERPDLWIVAGQTRIQDGMLRSLPMMESIARFTGNQVLRALPLHTAQAAFRIHGPSVEFRQILAESEGMVRLEGAASVEGATVEGEFQLGVSTEAMHWLPGARERVFLSPREGYYWAPMRIAGPVEAPEEDLSERLLAAAKAELWDRPEKVLERGIEAVGNWLRSVLE
jgi:hypothetical protein